ncbi:serine hydrolase [Telmatobacter sp. DSM 110680]|uniref:Serine hydrolase n=1 Tax=Telmatobacter sp. DSM 110680 TaxID=3036704 RepID=A0AAU7DHD6_9BACT
MDVIRTESHSSVADMPDEFSHFETVYKVLRDAINAHAFPGCAFGVLADGQIVLNDALGCFTYEEDAPSVESHTVFDVASITKVASTTAIAMLLHQRGQLDLDTPLGDLLPGFVVGRDSARLARQVTIRHLLAHNSGLPGYVEFFRSVSTPADLYRACLELPLETVPGERAEYSDPGFILLGKALEVLTREELPEFARKEIFQPLGMTATRFSPASEQKPLIPPTEIDNQLRHRRIQGEVQDENAYILHGAAGHAGLFSNVADLLKFAGAILSSGGDSFQILFSSNTVETFAERQGPAGSSRALGWDTPSQESSAGQYFSPHSIGHLGFSGCSLWIDLDASVAAVLLTNRTWPDRQSQLIREVRPSFHDAVRVALSGRQPL